MKRQSMWMVAALLGALAVALVAAILAGTAWGSVRIPVGVIGRMIALRLHLPGAGVATWPASWETIVFTIRLPRVILAALVGASLSVAGATYQGLFRNPLAEPYLIGVASGAALGRRCRWWCRCRWCSIATG